jgi:hypothetical protein
LGEWLIPAVFWRGNWSGTGLDLKSKRAFMGMGIKTSLLRMNNSQVQKGDVAVLIATAKFMEAGLIVLKPVSESLPYDLVIATDKHFYRVQVKRAQKRRASPGRYSIPFRKVTVNRNKTKVYTYTEEHTDFLVGVIVETSELYVYPLAEIKNISSMVVVDPGGLSKKRNGPQKVDSERYRNVLNFEGRKIKL